MKTPTAGHSSQVTSGKDSPGDAVTLQPKRRSSSLWVRCALSGLLGGVVYSHWIDGVQWDSVLPHRIPPLGIGSWPVAWVALIPYFTVLFTIEGRRWICTSFVFATLWHLSSLLWLATLLPFNPFIPLGVVLLAVSLACFTLLFAWSGRVFMKRTNPVWWPAILATSWVGTEYLRTLGPFAFPWNFLGHSQALGNAWGCQIADVGGTLAVSWIVVYSNAFVAMVCLALMVRHSVFKPPITLCALLPSGLVWAALIIFQFIVYPFWSTASLERAEGSLAPLRVAVVQPNIPQFEKMRFYMAPDAETANALDYEMTTKSIQLLQQACSAAQKPLDLIVMPESSFNSNYFVYDHDLHKTLEVLAEACSACIIFGADRRESESQYARRLRSAFSGDALRELPKLETCVASDGTTFPCEREPMVSTVAAFYVTPADGLTSRVYDKIHLVPFGETAPVVDKIPYFQEWVLMVGSYARGTEFTLFPLGTTSFGVMICFESTFPTLARAYVRRGAGLLCIITNDAWYDATHVKTDFDFWRPETPPLVRSMSHLYSLGVRKLFLWLSPDFLLDRGPIQHLAHATLRAIETRRPVVRSANTGISATIGPTGEIRHWLGWKKRGVFYDDLHPAEGKTIYARLGDWPGWLGGVMIISAVALQLLELASRRRATVSNP
ncbi:MAG: apolipoprotein N-acyltransferase [Candidatus Sumerlaeaceae bacterium]|nr:apolipoprotein N-acyltransferase [Candidatus Sumerlaeaceae bacterium]